MPARAPAARIPLATLLPSGRSVVAGIVVALVAFGGYVVARQSSLFAVEQVVVRGAPGPVARDARAALSDVEGRSLLRVDLSELERQVEAVPTVASARLDRAFPHRLVVDVVPEREVAVVRSGSRAWLVSERGRITAPLARRARPRLPRIWLRTTVPIKLGGVLSGRPRDAVRAVAPLAGSPTRLRVASVSSTGRQLELKLRSGLLVRLGDASDIALKLAVASRIIVELDGDEAYVDVAVPERPVTGTTLDSHVEIETSGESTSRVP